MAQKNLTLASRIIEFKSVIENITFTDKNQDRINTEQGARKFIEQLLINKEKGKAVYIIGNGGSASIASHALTDFLNVCRLRAFTLHDSSLITCMANDFGYENAFARIINTVVCPGDILIAISSSGKSANICNAARISAEKGALIITLTGFSKDNPLRKLGDLNCWLDSTDYGMVEIGHQFILHNIADQIGFESKKGVSASVEQLSELCAT